MTILQKRRCLIKIQANEKDIETLRKIRVELASEPFVSATLASEGGSKSYTRADLGRINEAIEKLLADNKAYRNALSGQLKGCPSQIYQGWF